MNPKLLELAMRHGALQARIAEQRRQLARHAAPLEAALAKGDAVLDGVGIAVATVVVARPKRAWRWARRGFFLWRGWTAIRNKLAGAV